MSSLLPRLEAALEREQLRAVDVALAEWCERHGGSAAVVLAMALVSRALGDGHTCLLLNHTFEPAVPGEKRYCDRDAFIAALEQSPLCGDAGERLPLILDNGRLYQHRYWQYEIQLAGRLRTLMDTPPSSLDTAPLTRDGGLFDYGWVEAGQTHWQAVAAATALRHRFCVISGGPGTGKTYTVLRLMRLLVESALSRETPVPRITLAAPTGKAAMRMMESIRQGLAEMADADKLQPHLPRQAATLHRLLGLRQGSTRAAHDRDNPLPAEVVIVDEASMVDLPMMARLAEAVDDNARLVLLGDRYQLASVESGSVLAELCSVAGVNSFSAAQHKALKPLLGPDTPAPVTTAGMGDHVVTLQTSHRFHPDSPIGRLAAAVNEGEAETALRAATQANDEIDLQLAPEVDREALVSAVVADYSPLFAASAPEMALATLDSMRLLTATRVGPLGAEQLNRHIHDAMAEQHGFDPARRWYHGRPVIILHNDYRLGLFNGDTGVCLRDGAGQLRVWFATPEGLRAILPTALPQHESVYAMTVHKSQGSEFGHVRLVLPERDNPVLSRELVYTGMTRARRRLTLITPEAVLRAALARTVARESGLAARLAD